MHTSSSMSSRWPQNSISLCFRQNIVNVRFFLVRPQYTPGTHRRQLHGLSNAKNNKKKDRFWTVKHKDLVCMYGVTRSVSLIVILKKWRHVEKNRKKYFTYNYFRVVRINEPTGFSALYLYIQQNRLKFNINLSTRSLSNLGRNQIFWIQRQENSIHVPDMYAH